MKAYQITPTMPANNQNYCDCCEGNHRKLFLVKIEGREAWVGKNCANDIKLYLQNNNIESIVWKGYEKQYIKVKRMIDAF